MSVKRRDLVKYFGFSLLREGKKHSIYAKGQTAIPRQATPHV